LALTFDTDWVPQFVMDHVWERLRARPVPATVFCTSAYKFPDDLELEAGLHPNFMPGSTHGASEDECLSHLRALYPQAKGSRSHRLFWHSGLRGRLMGHGIRYDASTFCPLQPHLEPWDLYGFTKLPVWWGDGFHLLRGLGTARFAPPGLETPGLKILVFHPIHIYLNTAELERTKAGLAGLDLPRATPRELEPWRNPGPGVATLFQDVLTLIARRGGAGVLASLLTA